MNKFICAVCHHDCYENVVSPAPGRVCGNCQHLQKNQTRTEFLARVAALPMEERLARIESELHDVRIKQLRD